MTSSRRYRLDRSVERYGAVLLGGSPLRVLRFNPAAQRLLDAVWPVSGSAEAFEVSVTDDATAGLSAGQLIGTLVDTGMMHPCPAPQPVAGRVTIVTPAYEIYGDERTGVVEQSTADRVRHIVVDDGSDPPIKGATIRLERNRGPAAARNAGLAMVTTPFVAFVDTDVAVCDSDKEDGATHDATTQDEWLERLIGHFDDPLVALVAPRVRAASAGSEGRDLSRRERYEKVHSPLDLDSDPTLVRPGARVGYVPATAIVCRTEALRQVGGFDETLRFGEDVDLVWRLTEAGFRCRYDPNVVVTHPPRSSWKGWWQQRVGYGTSAAPLAARHGEAVAPARLNRWSLLAWVVALGGPVSWLASVVMTLVAAARLPRRIPSLPPERARRLAIVGTWRAGDQLASAVRRGWWPLLLIASVWSRRARRALVLSVVMARTPLRLADDTAYSVGVWKGCQAERSLRALVPKIT